MRPAPQQQGRTAASRGGRRPVRRSWAVWLTLAAAALGACTLPLLGQPAARPGPDGPAPPASGASADNDLIQMTRNVPGESKQIQLAGDEVYTWQEGGQHVVLLRGQTLVQLGFVQGRCHSCVAWVDMNSHKQRGLWHVTVYGEGNARIDTSTEVKDGGRMLLDLYTRGELKVHSGKSKVMRQDLSRDPLVQRGRAARKQPSPDIETTSGSAPRLPDPSAFVPDSVKRTGFQPGAETPFPSPGTTPGGPPVTSPPIGPLPPGPVTPPGTAPAAEPVTTPGAAPQPFQPIPTGQPRTPAGKTTSLQPGLGNPALVPTAPGRASPPRGGTSPSLGLVPAPLPPPSQPGRPMDAATPPPDGPGRQYSVAPRSAAGFDIKMEPLPNGEQAIIVTGGVILSVKNAPNIGMLDLEADRLVIFTRDQNPQQVLNSMRNPQGKQNDDLEFYLSGNVEVRQRTSGTAKTGEETRTLRAAEVYYDIKRNVAVSLDAQLELRQKQTPEPLFFQGAEILQTSATTYEVMDAEAFSSKLPSDPGLKISLTQATIEERTVPRWGLFGQVIDRQTGQPLEKKQTWVRGSNVFFEVADVPFFYLPYVAGDARDPLGPIEDFRLGWSGVYGFQIGVGLNMYDLLGIQPYEDTRWLLDVDYLSDRGPGLGTRLNYARADLFGTEGKLEGLLNAYGIYDQGTDQLGGFRPQPFIPDDLRGRVLWRQQAYDLPYGFTVQSQVAYQSDRNFLEQYFKRDFDSGLPEKTYLYVKQQQDSWAWTGYANARLRDWMNETEYLPRAEGHLLGLSLFDVFTYNSQVGATYARLRTSDDGIPQVNWLTDSEAETGRINWMQELSAPFSLGALRVVPYGKLDLAGYSEDLFGESVGRVWGGGGVRASLPFSRLYPDAHSELFNVNGINHKIVLRGNYFWSESSEPFWRFPQLDRLNSEVDDQGLREVRTMYPSILPNVAGVLVSPLYDPQVYAIRRLIDNRIDTLDSVEVFQAGIHQRWQTKRGYPGSQHIIDWMTLDLSASFFPNQARDNFGETVAFMEYDWSWNIGDRTTLVSSGWVDPIEDGPRVFNVGAHMNRPDRTSFYLGYRHIDPLESRAVTGSVSYIFSPKYALTAGATYDFGTSTALTNTLVLTRMGTDLQISVGVTYDALQSNVGALVQIVPNLVPEHRRPAARGLNQR